MTPSEIIKRIPLWYKDGTSIHMEGPPGVGKTHTWERAPALVKAKYNLNLGIVVINGAQLTPLHTIGFGVAKHNETFTEMLFSLPFFFKTREGKYLWEYDGGYIFVDEADKADPDVKKILGEVRLSRRSGPHDLPPGWILVSAGNRAKDRSGSTKRYDHEINRYREIQYEVNLASWVEWAEENGVSGLTIGFASTYPQLVFRDEVPKEQGPWCTPRSLVAADRYMQLLKEEFGDWQDDAAAQEEIRGQIGGAESAAYFTHVKLQQQMPSYESIVAKPMEVKIPDRADALMLIMYHLAHRMEIADTEAVLKYVERSESKEFVTLFARNATKRLGTALLANKTFREWMKANAALIAQMNLLSA